MQANQLLLLRYGSIYARSNAIPLVFIRHRFILIRGQAMSSDDQAAVTGHRFSTVVPGDVTSSAAVHELTGMDLIMKLHYLRAVYYFAPSEVVDGFGIMDLKKPMFPWLNVYYPLAGRIRRAAEGGRPFIKCNDCGLRIVEASCGRTLEEWLHADQEGATTRWRSLVPDKVLGPELHFSPLVYIQVR